MMERFWLIIKFIKAYCNHYAFMSLAAFGVASKVYA